MDKTQAIAEIIDIQCGGGIDRSKFPDTMKGSIPRKLWNDCSWGLAMEYGYILALMDVFGITKEELW